MQYNYGNCVAHLIYDDCLIAMSKLPDKSIDLILCDLPYGTTKCKWDVIIPLQPLWEQYQRVIKDNGAILLFGQEPFSSVVRSSNLKWYRYDWYWQKERLTNVLQVKKRPGKVIENICVFYKKQPIYHPQMTKYEGTIRTNKVKDGKLGTLIDDSNKTVFEYQDNGYRYPLQVIHFQRDCLKERLIDTQKPVELLKYLIKTYTDEYQVVLDNCMGSGSTGVACAQINRSFIGIDNDIQHYNIAVDRMNRLNLS